MMYELKVMPKSLKYVQTRFELDLDLVRLSFHSSHALLTRTNSIFSYKRHIHALNFNYKNKINY